MAEKKVLYGAAVDLTGVTAHPKKLKISKRATHPPIDGVKQPDTPTAWELGEDQVKKPGLFKKGDGRTARVLFAADNLNDVKTWFKGVEAVLGLLRATATEGK